MQLEKQWTQKRARPFCSNLSLPSTLRL